MPLLSALPNNANVPGPGVMPKIKMAIKKDMDASNDIFNLTIFQEIGHLS